MGYTEAQYSSFKLKALQAQEKLIVKLPVGRTTSWTKYCKIYGDGVPVDNYAEGGGLLQAEKEEKEEANRSQKR